jgi:hypothetical protein
MMDGSMFPRSWHPTEELMNRKYTGKAKYYTRTQRPPKYYLIDFGISRRYDAKDLPVLEPQIHGADRTVPEFQDSFARCDPFPTDIYYLGNVFRMDFVQVSNDVYSIIAITLFFLWDRRKGDSNLWLLSSTEWFRMILPNVQRWTKSRTPSTELSRG